MILSYIGGLRILPARDRRAVCVSSHTHINPCRASICVLACVHKICFHSQKFQAFALLLLKVAVPLLCLRPHIEHITSAFSYLEFKSVLLSGFFSFFFEGHTNWSTIKSLRFVLNLDGNVYS